MQTTPIANGPTFDAARPTHILDVRDETIFSVFETPAGRCGAGAWLWLLALVLVGWVGAVAFIGQYRKHQVVLLLYAIAPPRVLYGAAVAVALILFASAALTRRRHAAAAAAVVTAFLLGHLSFAWLYLQLNAHVRIPFHTFTEAVQFAVSRLAYAVGLLMPMLAAWFLVVRSQRDAWPPLRLGVGNLAARARDTNRSAPLVPWWKQLVGGYGVFCVVIFLVMQANVGFQPLLSGTLWRLLPAVLVAAVANAIAEEYIFRGLIQPAFIRAGGVAAGLWMQGLMFGLMHWGMSVGILAALPVSLLIGLGSVIFGKAALDTRGMGWVVVAHTMIDVSVMSAFFVPRA